MWPLQDFRRTSVAATASPIEFDVVCDACQTYIFRAIRLHWYDFDKQNHLKVRDLFASAARGCHMCNLIRGAVCNDLDYSTKLTSVLPWNWIPSMGARVMLEPQLPLRLHVHVLDSKRKKSRPCGAIEWWSGPRDVQLDQRPTGNELSVDQAVPLIWKWIGQCEHGHTIADNLVSCPSSRKARQGLPPESLLPTARECRTLPTRLLQLSPEASPIGVQLVLSNEIDPATEYVTLSYCWGGDVPYKLTKSRIEDYRQSIPYDTLPQTLKDAVLLTVGLGLRHIWVDAFCIIQQDDKDWQAESPNMGDVYANGFLNIAADAAKTSEGGLFRKRNPLAFSVCSLVNENINAQDTNLFCWRQPRLDNTVCPSPLFRRGWAVQERLLAPRTVHFGFDQLMWLVRCP